jgi:hypothetical protein
MMNTGREVRRVVKAASWLHYTLKENARLWLNLALSHQAELVC